MVEAVVNEAETGKERNASLDVIQENGHGAPRRFTGPARRSSKGNWTEEEDAILKDAVQRLRGKAKGWKKIAAHLPGRSDVQCLHRWEKVLNPNLVKGPWSKQEDDLLIELVNTQGCKKWSRIAEQLPGRIGKQCRERWSNHLKPDIKRSPWTREEEEILVNAQSLYGNKWSEIVKLLPGRTENSVKNHWNCSLKKKLDNYSTKAGPFALNHLPPQLTVAGAGTMQFHTAETGQHVMEKTRQSSLSTKYDNKGSSYCLDLVLWNCNKRPGTMENQSCSYPHGEHSDPSIVSGSLISTTKVTPMKNHPRSSSSGCSSSYSGLCYRPLEESDANLFVKTGKFPSTGSYIPHSKESSDVYVTASPRFILRLAAMSFHNTPSIITRRRPKTDSVCGSL